MNDTASMKLSLNIKQPAAFFWIRKIRDVNITKCCVECFIGEKDSRLFHGTKYKETPSFFELDVEPSEKYVAYYLCGMSRGYKYDKNIHIAFIHAPGEDLRIDTEQIDLTITNARRVDFEGEGYIPNPPGEFTDEQRSCRNWIFANYINDKMLNIQQEVHYD